jgi:hypothetical protein
VRLCVRVSEGSEMSDFGGGATIYIYIYIYIYTYNTYIF